MNFKKITLTLLTLTLSTSLFVACGNKVNNKEPKVTTKEQAEKLDTLKHLGPYEQFDPNTDPTAKLLEELTGEKVEYTLLPAEQAMEKLNLEIAAESQFNSVKLYRNQYDILVGKNVLLDLKPYLEEYGKNILEAIDQKSWDSVTIDGKIYGIPEKNPSDNINSALFVRTDILDKYGLTIPKTTEDFYNVCVTLKDKGVKIPASLDTKLSAVFAGAFGLTNEWNEVDGELVYRGADPALKDYLDYMKKLNTEGLLGSDWVTLDRNTAKERFINGDTAFMVGAWWEGKGIFEAMKTQSGIEKPEEVVGFVGTLEGPDGKFGVPRDGNIAYVTSIPKYMEKYAVQTIQWIDKKLEADNFKKLTIGDEGYHYTVQNGDYFPVLELNEEGKAKFDEKNNSSWYLTGTRETDYAKYWQARVRKTNENFLFWSNMNSNNDKIGVYNPLGFAPQIESLSLNKQALDTYVGDFVIKYIAGEDNDFDSYLNGLKSQNIEQITKDVNDAVK